MLRSIAIAVALAAYRSGDASAPAPAPASAPPPTPPSKARPFDPFASWDVPARRAALEGAWVQNVGIPRVPIEIRGGHVTITDPAQVAYDVVAVAPCELVLRKGGAVDPNRPAMPFALRNGKVVITTDDVLHSRFDYPNLGIRVRDLAAASALVAEASADDGVLQAARALGGVEGDTTTLPGLAVTAAAAPKRWNGKQVTLHAVFYGGDFSDESAAFWSHLVPSMDQPLPMVSCDPLEPTGVAPGDPVTVTGTVHVEQGSKLPSLGDCTIEKTR